MIKGLKKNNVNVIECHETLFTSIEERVNAVQKGWRNPKLWIKIFTTYFRLFKKYIKILDFDFLVIGYPGQFDIFFAKLLNFKRKKPIIWDVFMSIYLISRERGLDKKNFFIVKLLKIIEHFSLKLPNKLIIDTQQYATWLCNTYKIPLEKFCIVPTGADDEVFSPDKEIRYNNQEKMNIIYYGTFIPNHDVPFIIEAARILREVHSIGFILIGDGPDLIRCQKQVENYKLENVEFIQWLDQGSLKVHINKADIVLGAFGKTPQSLMTIQNKIYESMAMKKLVITGESEAINCVFANNVNIITCNRESPNDLANSILKLQNDPGLIKQISTNAALLYNSKYTIKSIGRKFINCIMEIHT
jgi:glycosyltransferase involved in cell wall biosynthesis